MTKDIILYLYLSHADFTLTSEIRSAWNALGATQRRTTRRYLRTSCKESGTNISWQTTLQNGRHWNIITPTSRSYLSGVISLDSQDSEFKWTKECPGNYWRRCRLRNAGVRQHGLQNSKFKRFGEAQCNF